MPQIKVVDIFAGGGGLGEGFASFKTADGGFSLALSVEKDPVACRTLEVRAFYRSFNGRQVPEGYYHFLRGKESYSELEDKYPENATTARREVFQSELGAKGLFQDELDDRILTTVNLKNDWILVGGPPCQAYSTAGRALRRQLGTSDREGYEKHFLYREYLRLLAYHQPAVFVLENVKGVLSSNVRGEGIFKQIILDLGRPVDALEDPPPAQSFGYSIYSLVTESAQQDLFGQRPGLSSADFVIESEKYGVPQARHRVVLLGIRQDLRVEPGLLERAPQKITVSDVIDDLPRLRGGISGGDVTDDEWVRTIRDLVSRRLPHGADRNFRKDHRDVIDRMRTTVKKLSKLTRGGVFIESELKNRVKYRTDWYHDRRIRGVCDHETRTHMPEDLLRYLYAACFARHHKTSPKLGDYPEVLHPAHRNVKRALGNGMFNDRFRVQVRDAPATTVMSHISKDGHYYIHYDPGQFRSMTVREAARLQTFPDNYYFAGTRTQQYIQIGNAVPPLLATQIAEIVYDVIERSRLVGHDRYANA